VEHYEAMTNAMLAWEIDHGIFEEDFEEWRMERGY